MERITGSPSWIGINIYAFSLNFHTSALLTIVAPAALTRLAGSHHTQVLGRVAAASSLIAMILPLVVGIWSDAVKAKGGLRWEIVREN